MKIIRFLASRNWAFRGKNEILFQAQNGNFLGLIELLSKFDPVRKEHVTRFMKSEFQNHYLSARMQNAAIAQKTINSVIEKVNEGK